MPKAIPYDVLVIGAGPGGYVCAIRCAQLGLTTSGAPLSHTPANLKEHEEEREAKIPNLEK